MKVKAYLEITMKIDPENRAAAAKVYTDYRRLFLDSMKGAFVDGDGIRDINSFGLTLRSFHPSHPT